MHRKYRPKNWDEVIGNEEIVESLKQIGLKSPVMFQGTYGSGKTTMALILAKEYGVTKENLDYFSCRVHSGVDYIREKLKGLENSSLFGKKKVIVLDETYGLSKPAMGALLTPLENLPDNVGVIACTSSIQNMDEQFLSRWIRYTVRPLNNKQAKQLIDRVLQGENFSLSNNILKLLIIKGEGIPRRLLTTLPKLKGITDLNKAKYLIDVAILEEQDPDALDVFKLVLTKNWKGIKGQLKKSLKKKSVGSIRIGMMNIAAERIMSDYMKPEEGVYLQSLYGRLKNAEGIPEKGNLIHAIYSTLVNSYKV